MFAFAKLKLLPATKAKGGVKENTLVDVARWNLSLPCFRKGGAGHFATIVSKSSNAQVCH